ncbi:hypothetical protein Ae201684_007910 [Aphanomyces euteiches]|uniref:Secreted protein n=1 Tax=Aphanomyces euteiches TaxID=100861 RepID=A0A6G0X6M1_9STRA|nr:hypothetical protein Ae201684_007910 [Aphanomyces euteiches]
MKFAALLSIASVVAQAPAPCTEKQAGVVVAAVNASTNLAGCTKDSGFNWLTFFTTDAIPTDAQATASLASKSCLALVGEANGLKLESCTLWNNDLAKLVTQDPVAWIKAKSSAVKSSNSTLAACTSEQAGVVVAAVNASTNLAGCTKDSGFNWLTFFTTDAIPTDAQATASLASKSCLALVGEANGLKLQPCQLWNNDLSKLVTQDPVAWIKAKSSADSGFNWLTFFTTDAIPTDAQATASLASKSCLALVGEANGLKLQPCQLWNNDLSKLVTQDPVAWIKAKSSAVKSSNTTAAPGSPSNSTASTAAPSSSSNATATTAAPTTTPKSSASGVVAGLAAVVIALVMQ